MSATGSAGVLTFESPWVVNHAASASRIRSCSALSLFPTIPPTSQRLHHKGIREGADAGLLNQGLGEVLGLPSPNFCGPAIDVWLQATRLSTMGCGLEHGGCDTWPERLRFGRRCGTYGQDHLAGDAAPSGSGAGRL